MNDEKNVPPRKESDQSAGVQMSIATLIISAFLFVGKIAGYVKDMVLSGYFGSSASTDAFYFIYNNIVFMLYAKIEKLLRPTYLPQFVKKLKSSEAEAWRITSIIFNLHFLAIVVIVVLLEIFAPNLVKLLWPNLVSTPENLAMTVGLFRIMAPALLLFSPSVMPELTLHSYKQFTVPALADTISRIGLLGILFVAVEYLWHPDHPHAIYAAGLGILVGFSLRFVVQIPALWSKLKNYVFTIDLQNTAVRTIFALMPPVVVGLVFSAARGFADSIFADRVGTGVYTCLTFGRKMTDAPLQILPLAVSFVVYPYLSQWATEGAKDKLADSLVSMTRAMAYIFVPSAVAIMMLSRVVISVMFEHGEFGPEGASLAAIALFCYAAGMMTFAVEGSINKWYFALEDTSTPNYVGAAMAVLHIIIGYTGVYIVRSSYTAGQVANLSTLGLGIAAIALALTISKTAKVVILYGLLLKRIGAIDMSRVYGFIGKLAISSGVMAVAIHLTLMFVHDPVWALGGPLESKKVKMIILLLINGAVGTAAYLGASALLRIDEFDMVWDHLAGRVKKRLGR
ncbi:MAG: lipid II flippase MurJ [Armatimonadota bacterium]